MGNILTFGRSGGSSDETESGPSQAYLYPPKSGNYFTSHFIMGGERFETSQPEMYLFGENLDLNFLGGKPSPFPYSAPLPQEPTRTLRSLINIRKESLRFIRVTNSALIPVVKPLPEVSTHVIVETKSSSEIPEKPSKRTSSLSSSGGAKTPVPNPATGPTETPTTAPASQNEIHYNIEFTFDSDVKCAITIYYFALEEITCSGITYTPRDPSICSDTIVFKRGSNQVFTHETHIFSPFMYNEDDLMYRAFDENGYFDPKVPFPCVIQCVALEGDAPRQSHALIAVIERNSNGSFSIKPFIQKIFIDGLYYLLQEIYGIENKGVSTIKSSEQYISPEDDIEDSGSECVVCLSDSRDTLILPCRHLCLCNACADSLRYQANNCPICRAPFRALLQIQAVRKTRPASVHIPHSIITSTSGTQLQPSGSGVTGSTTDLVDVPPGYEPYSLIEALNGPSAVQQQPSTHGMYTFRSEPENRTPLGVRRSLRKERNNVREDIPLPIRRTTSSTPEVVVSGRISSPPDKPVSDHTSPRKGSDGSTSIDGGNSRGRRSLDEIESTSSTGSAAQETTRLLCGREKEVENRSNFVECSPEVLDVFNPHSTPQLSKNSKGRSSPKSPKELTSPGTGKTSPASGAKSSTSYTTVSLRDGLDEQDFMVRGENDSNTGSIPNMVTSQTDEEEEAKLFVDAPSSFDESVLKDENHLEMKNVKLAEFETTDDLDVED